MPMPFTIEFTDKWRSPRYMTNDVRLVGPEQWVRLIPLLHSTLAAPSAIHVWPRYASVGEHIHAYR
jgi:hypothetical protein